MIAAFRRIPGLVAIGFAGLVTTSPAEVMGFRYAVGSTVPPATGGTASFTSVEARPGIGTSSPARTFAGGYFTGTFEFAPPTQVGSQAGEDGMLTALTRNPATGTWEHDWILHVPCTDDARINDVALEDNGMIFVTGTFSGTVTFERTLPLLDIQFTTGATEGFVAWAGPNGEWLDAFQVASMEPRSLALAPSGDIYLTGPPVLARRYNPSGVQQWNMPEPADTISLNHIVLGPSPNGLKAFVTGSFDADPGIGGVDEDVFLARVDATTGDVDWNRFVESPGTELPGALGVGPRGELRLAFSSDSATVSYDGSQIPTPPLAAGRHAHVLDLTPAGNPVWNALLGQAAVPGGSMECDDLAVDPFGNVHVATTFTGTFTFEGLDVTGQEDAAVVSLDATGEQYNFARSAGSPAVRGRGIAAPDRNLQVLVGDHLGPGTTQFGTYFLPAAGVERAYLAILGPEVDQAAYIVSSNTAEPPVVIREELNAAGAQVYRLIDAQAQGVQFVSAFVTNDQLNDLAGRFVLEPDQPLESDGVVDPAGWALAHLNDASGGGTTYTYPETCRETVLYLIDTAIDNSSGYFDGNTNLTLGDTILVRGTGDPLVSSSFDHGTKMLSMIAGPTHGVAEGTPVTVVNYDIYATPGGLSTRLSALVEAVTLANAHKLTNHPFDPAAVCIASSASSTSATAPALEPAIQYTTGSDVRTPVILSAGNTTGLAANYTPSYIGGTVTGAICAGAIDSANSQVATTRGGAAVDLWAPGNAVAATDTSGSATTVTGTSASAALTAGAALVYLSGNPFADATALETALVTTFSQSDTIGAILSVPDTGVPWFTSFADWADWYLLTDTALSGNDDGDQWTNEEEFIWGYDPTVSDLGPLLGFSYDPGTTTLTVEFPLACYLYDGDVPSTHTLRDSSALKIMRSSDLSSWTDITNTLTITEVESNDGQITLSFDYGVSSSPCFFRVTVAP